MEENVALKTEVEEHPTTNPYIEAQPEKIEENRFCPVIERYKKPMAIMVILLLLILNTVMLVRGIIEIHYSHCPIDPIIPTYLIGGGAVGIITRLMMIVKYCAKIQSIILKRIIYGFLVVELIILITASCFIFIHYKNKQNSCNGNAFMWAYLMLIFNYIILLSPIIVPCCMECYHGAFMHKMRLVA